MSRNSISKIDIFPEMDMFLLALKSRLQRPRNPKKLKSLQNTNGQFPENTLVPLGNSASAPNRTSRGFVHNINARYLSRDGYVPASVEIGAVKGPGIPKIEIPPKYTANSLIIRYYF